MSWEDSQYFYSTVVLKDIANSYQHIYRGIEVHGKGIYRYTITNRWSIAEYKVDFDTALDKLGQSRYPSRAPKWTGELESVRFSDYKWFSRRQQIVIADILGITDNELLDLGFYDIPQLRGRAYQVMRSYLNGE